MRNLLVIPDLHIPYEHPKALAFVCQIRDKYKCAEAISVGDVVDLHSISYHEHNPDMAGPAQELEAAQIKLTAWVKEFPKLTVTIGNHDSLIDRKMTTHGIPAAAAKSLSSMLGTPRWTWAHEDIREGGRHRIWFRHHWAGGIINRGGEGGYSVVCGHTHTKAQIVWSQYPSHSTFSLVAGCLINPASPAFAYNRSDARRPILACATIIDGQPQIHRMFI